MVNSNISGQSNLAGQLEVLAVHKKKGFKGQIAIPRFMNTLFVDGLVNVDTNKRRQVVNGSLTVQVEVELPYESFEPLYQYKVTRGQLQKSLGGEWIKQGQCVDKYLGTNTYWQLIKEGQVLVWYSEENDKIFGCVDELKGNGLVAYFFKTSIKDREDREFYIRLKGHDLWCEKSSGKLVFSPNKVKRCLFTESDLNLMPFDFGVWYNSICDKELENENIEGLQGENEGTL